VATIDRDALRQRYLAERDKRLRPDGNDQYGEPVGRFAGPLDDPYVARVERASPAVTGSPRLSLVGHPQGAVAFFEHIERWRASGTFEGLEFRPATT
jgi:hypothetical protein